MTTAKKKAAKPTKVPTKKGVTMKNGTPFNSLSPQQKVSVIVAHLTPGDPDHNPEGRTVTGADLTGVAAPVSAIFAAHEQSKKNRDGGRAKGTKSNRLKAEEGNTVLKREVKRLLDIESMSNPDLYFEIKPIFEKSEAFKDRPIESPTIQKKIERFAAAYRKAQRIKKVDKSG